MVPPPASPRIDQFTTEGEGLRSFVRVGALPSVQQTWPVFTGPLLATVQRHWLSSCLDPVTRTKITDDTVTGEERDEQREGQE